MNEPSVEAGVQNMLCHCGGASCGQRLLIAYEPPEFGFFDPEVVDCLASQAAKIGLIVERVCVGFDPEASGFPPELHSKMTGADIVVFLARLGDQLRFSQMPDDLTIINSYTLTKASLASAYASAHYDAFVDLKRAVDRFVASSDEIVISCPAGTAIRGHASLECIPANDTTLKRFPLTVFSPVPAAEFSGKAALGGFLTGTGSRYYPDYTAEFNNQVFAHFEMGRLTGFEGDKADVAKADAHYNRVSTLFGIDRDFVHSWHAGIHPGCGFPWDLSQNYETWGGAAFGNPRILHFHTCGAYAPGEISWNVFDPTIEIDGVALWQDGVFVAELLPEGPEILNRYGCAKGVFARPDRRVGLGDV